MLACLPASGDPTRLLLSRTQMNTGLQKWETTQKMRSANYPTPAELDAYAKKIANSPLTIQIFPNSVKVPQRKHIRRTVNGLDTSLSSQRHSPYPSQVSARAGLLAVLRAPTKGVIKQSDGSHLRLLHKSMMNPHSGPYATQSTLNLPQPAGVHLQGPSQPPQPQVMAAHKQGMVHPQALQQQQQQQQNLSHPMTLQQAQIVPQQHQQSLQQRNVAHSQALQRQQSLSQMHTSQQQKQGLGHPQGLQRQQSLPHTQTLQQKQSQSCSSIVPPPPPQQQHLSHLQTLHHQTAPPHHQALLQPQGVTQDHLRHMSDGAQLPSLQQHPQQGLAGPQQPLSQAGNAGPPVAPGPNGLQQQQQQPLPGAYGPRKLPDADAPPNITVSTSTIPLSMASSLHQNRPGDLSSIVHQINQFCQARAGIGTTSVCEGQIANPSPISRNLLINASSRVSSHNLASGSMPSACMMGGGPDKAPPQGPAAVAPQPQHNMATMNSMSVYHTDAEQQQMQQQQQQQQQMQQQKQQQMQHHLQQQMQHQQMQQLQQQRSWAQHQLAHMQQPAEGAHPCKTPRREPPPSSGPAGFPTRNLNYPHKLPSAAAQSYPLKHQTDKTQSMSPGINGPSGGNMSYNNGHYMQPPWASIPTTSSNNAPQDLPMHFQGGQPRASLDCSHPGAKFRPGKAAGPHPGQSKLTQGAADYLGGDYQMPSFPEQNLGVMEKMHRPTGQAQEPNNGRGVHTHHPGYR